MDNKWIEVAGAQDIPVGTWLVQVEKDRDPYHVAIIHTNINIIGNCFDFARPRVLRYKKLDIS